MKHPRRATAAAIAPVTALALATTLLGGTADGAPRSAASGAAATSAATGTGTGTGTTVTLVTGDKVTLDGTGRVTGVQTAKGRDGITFRINRTTGGSTYVIPSDAEKPLADGTADRRLFDVTGLVELGYDDSSRDDTPLIVTYAEGRTVARSSLSSAGAEVARDLPSVNGDAVSAPKSGSGVWQTLTGSGAQRGSLAASVAPKVERIWLDGKVRASLDKSTAQIGAPAAWAAGYDGKGVKVAVLDTGVDTTHPDLKDRVETAKNFSESADTVDRVGHGTHVASTIAGSGAKSGGKYKGVAPGARLISGKVLDDNGEGSDSEIIAGMQWAVGQGAKVINLSLGGYDTPDTDPLEQAVNELSASSGALFVIAAGNEGPDAGTIGTPGSAAAALTVGAVDRTDAVADFSSRGPTADGSLKPDITAPGVDIVAAKAAQGTEGDPAADGYVSMSGTSMATPHVAGAAAILAQEHPDWTGERIKALLTSTAEPTKGVSAFAQGTGRTDLKRAVSQQVTAGPATLGFGTVQWPHTDDKPVAKEITYRNDGDAPVTLDLTTEASGEDGKPAAEGMFDVSPKRLTVPAGGTATATVTADTGKGTADGVFSGAVTAASGDVRVRTALGVNREVESYDLTLEYLDLEGKATTDAVSDVTGLDTQQGWSLAPGTDGTYTLRLPKGRYMMDGIIATAPGRDDDKQALLVYPKLTLERNTTVVMDARKADPVKITVPDARARNTDASVTFGGEVDGESFGIEYAYNSFDDVRVGQLGARSPAGEAYMQYSGTWTRGSVHYRPVWIRRGDLSGFTAKPKREQFARVNLSFGEPAKGKTLSYTAAPVLPDGNWDGPAPLEAPLPYKATEYVMPGVRWQYVAQQFGAPGADGEAPLDLRLTADPMSFKAGRTYTHRFDYGVFGPRMPAADGQGEAGVLRRGDEFLANVALFSDGAGDWGDSDWGKARSTLYQGSRKLFDVAAPLAGVPATLPAGQRAYRLVTDVSRPASLSAVSTRVTAEWTFRSAHVSEDQWQWLPLSAVRFTPKLSAANTAKAGRGFTVPFTIEGAATNRTARKVTVQVSYDDGRHWKKARVVAGRRVVLKHPARPGAVSLRVTLTDPRGGTTRQTIYRAYRTTK
ncbi:S8 family peptidase [Streptomyces sp. NPDC002588]|uniref:S8 family peptidase n=1 Tax=Streptomyces sp. NPDC002588 TaxID=3154419 RepID=UPI003327A586